MHYFLLGSSVMALIYLSAEGNIHVFQKPRFVGVKTGRTVRIYCVPLNPSLPARVEWFKDQTEVKLKNSQRIYIKEKSDTTNASLLISHVETEDSGTYFCKLNSTFGPGTELQVFSRCQFVYAFCLLSSPVCISLSVSSPGHTDPQTIMRRSKVKDVFIFLQALLLILCIVVPLVQFYRLEKKEDAVYEEPEDDHIYEGLEIEQCGGADLYEDITALARDTDAAWEVESPDQE
ncbi:B-cell antigen receptor complex-associated protein beta chain isoform X2 [Onychostoma macrolepis]|uniref:B-cell antigen receptor complex-associated protein beta chain isoform X2 n=1 Tax=Onychostoma macrolepis TaxID=369639 RepID=UPI00272CEB51|nr:B-cell antigen receptor complex-associated protein beta chain isoform X2 [Onychostoma macrolepis]